MLVKSHPRTASSNALALRGASTDQVVMSLLDRQNQLEVNQANFYRFQLAFNAVSVSRTNRLLVAQRRLEGQIVAGRAALTALGDSLEKEAAKVSQLQTTVSAAEEELEKVKSDLQQLERTIQQQSEQLSKQGTEIKRLSVSKVQREALVEAVVLLTALATIRSSFVNLPISTALMIFPKKSRITNLTRSVLRLFLFTVLLRKIRTYAVLTGWTSENASLLEYVMDIAHGKNL